MKPTFVHLHLHSEYSLVDGMIRVKPLAASVAEMGMPAVAVTDQSNLFSMVKFYRSAMGAGVKPIIGSDVWVHNRLEPTKPTRLVLLCKNKQGYLNLSELVSQSYLEGQQRGIPVLQPEWFQGKSDGLIALSSGRTGDVGQSILANKMDVARQQLQAWRELFPNSYYLELQRTGREGEEDYIHAAIGLALETDTPVVATNDVRFLKASDFDSHEARVCIHDGRTLDDPRRPRLYSDQQYLRSPEEMIELFADIPEAIENTVEIARRCNIELTLGKNFLPAFPIPEGMTEAEYFRQLSQQGLETRLRVLFDENAPDFAEKRQPYDERLEIELDVINSMGFPGYFLIVADFIQWAKNNGVPVGPGRGSGAGSLVAYALTITDLDPLEYDLLFERFLNPERVSMPDFDVDFCMEGRDRVIDYVAQHYGREKVSQIITYGSMAAKAVVRDVGRVRGHGYGFVDQIAKMIPFDLGITLTKALEQEEAMRDRYENDDEVKGLIDMALSLEGLARNAGKHAGGVVIAPSKLTDFTPIYCEQGGTNVVSQFDKDDVEAVGLVKFDFLGLRTLTIIDWALKIVNDEKQKTGEETVDISLIPLDDPATFDLLKACKTTAVFQLESRGMKDLIKRLQPDSFEDIVALVALFRPGPLQSGMVDNFINRKHGREAVSYPDAQYQHESLKPILEPTYGIILYQEQVMQIAQVLAGYTLGGADLLRRAMGKKKPEEMAKQRAIFEEGAKNNGVDGTLAMKIFDLVEKFAGYGFNKSHSAAYALVSYQTAWMKAHYPSAFMAAVLSADMDNTDKVVTLIDECNDMGLKVVPPSVNHSDYRFTTLPDGSVVYGLGAIKGVGEAAIESMVRECKAQGPYKDLFDFCRRIDMKKANRRVLESLIRAGALDQLGPNRATLMHALPTAIKMAEQHHQNAQAGVADMFGFEEEKPAEEGKYEFIHEWREDHRLQGEKETLGLYLTGHPIARYEPELKQFISSRISALKPEKNKSVVVAGLVIGVRTVNTRRGVMGIVTLDDRSARIEMVLFAEMFNQHREILGKDKVIVVTGEVEQDDFNGGNKLTAKEVYSIDQARERFAQTLRITIDEKRAGNGFVGSLKQTLEPFREGACPVTLSYKNQHAYSQIRLGENWRVVPSDELLHRLEKLAGSSQVVLEYTN